MIQGKGEKLSKLLFIAYTVFLLLFLGFWLISTETYYVPWMLLFLGLLLPLFGYFLTYFLKRFIEARDPRSHFIIVLNIVILTLTLLLLVVSTILFYTDSKQSGLGREHNEQVDAFVAAGDEVGCSKYLVGTHLVTVLEAQTTCNLRIAIATRDSSFCENIPDETKKNICLASFE